MVGPHHRRRGNFSGGGCKQPFTKSNKKKNWRRAYDATVSHVGYAV